VERHERPSVSYNVIIPYTYYSKIKPQSKLLRVKNTLKGTRQVWKIQKGWVDLILDSFFNQYGLPCSYAINYHNVSSEVSNGSYISFKGRCTDQSCRAVIFGDVINVPKPGEDVTLSILTVNTMDIEHSKKRFLREPKRSVVSKQLIWFIQMATDCS